MKTLKFSFLFYSLFLIIGLFFHEYILAEIAILILGVAIFFIAFNFKRKFTVYPSKWSFSKDVLLIGMLFISLGACVKKIQESTFDVLNTNDKVAQFIMQSVKTDVQIEEEVSSTTGKRYIGKLLRVNDSVVNTYAYLSFKENGEELIPGDIVSCFGYLRDIAPPKNIGQFDYKVYSEQKGVYFQLYGNAYIKVGRSWGIKYEILRWRFHLAKEVMNSSYLNDNGKGLLNALILGKRSDIDKGVLEQFKELGIMHILAISGLHVGLIYLILMIAFGFLRPISKQVIVVLLLWLFVFLSGFSPSVFRAVFMFTIFSIARIIRREQSLEHNVGLALFFSLFFYPSWVNDIGFQLSYLAVVSIVYILPVFNNYYSSNRLLKYVQGIIYVSVSVQIGLLPIQLFYFKQFSLLFLVGNLIVIPIVTVLIVLGILYFLTLRIGLLNQAVGVLFNFLTDLMYRSIGYLHQLDLLAIRNVQLSIAQVFILLGLLVCIALSYYRKTRVFVISSFLLFFIFQIVEKRKLEMLDSQVEYIVPFSSNKNNISFWKKEGSNVISFESRVDQEGWQTKELDYLASTLDDLTIYQEELLPLMPLDKEYLLVLSDSLPIYDIGFQVEVILLTGQPKINFERMLSYHQPKVVVFHNSMPFWFKTKCIESCIKNNIPFHDIYEKGYWSNLL